MMHFQFHIRATLMLLVVSGTSLAQQGEERGERQTRPLAREEIPPAPPLKPDQALKAFRLHRDFASIRSPRNR
jgi:hypothetical protein